MTVVKDFENNEAYAIDNVVDADGTMTIAQSTDRLFGSKSLQATYDFGERTAIKAILFDQEDEAFQTFGRGDTLGLHIYGDMGYNDLFLLLSDYSQTIEVPVSMIDYHGWRYVTVPLDALEDGERYHYAGFMLQRGDSVMGQSGAIRIDNLLRAECSGINEVKLANMQVRVSGDYIVVSADTWVQGVELLNLQGQSLKAAGGNCLNVSSVEPGIYLVRVHINGRTSTQKVVIN